MNGIVEERAKWYGAGWRVEACRVPQGESPRDRGVRVFETRDMLRDRDFIDPDTARSLIAAIEEACQWVEAGISGGDS